MASWIVIREYRRPIGRTEHRYPEGKVLDENDYDIPLLQSSGVRMVPFSQGLLNRIGGGDSQPGSAVAALAGDGGAITAVQVVDAGTLIGPNDQDGTSFRPFSDPQAAIDIALAVAPIDEDPADQSAAARVVNEIWMHGGTYDRDLSVVMSGSSHLKFVGMGPVNIGLMDANSYRPGGGPLRSITVTGDTATALRVDNVRAFFGIISLDDSDNNGGHSAANSAFRISGELVFDLPDSTGNNIVINLSSAQIFGTTAGDDGTSIRVLNNSNGAFQFYNCFFNGKCELGLDGQDTTRARQTRFRGLLTNEKMIIAETCDIVKGMTVRTNAVFTNEPLDGFVDCNLAGPFAATETGTEFMFDSLSQNRFLASINNPDVDDQGVILGTTIQSTLSEPYAPGTGTLTLDIDSTGSVLTTFLATDTTAQLVADRINAAFLAAGAPAPPAPAFVAAEGVLQISGVLTGPGGEVDVVSGTAVAALGLTVAVTTGTGATKAFRGVAPQVVLRAGGAPVADEFYEANATSSGTAGVLGVPTQSAPILQAGNLMAIAWQTASAAADTVMKVHEVGVGVVDTVTLDGASGTIALPRQHQVAPGAIIALEFDAGTAPGAGVVQVLMQ